MKLVLIGITVVAAAAFAFGEDRKVSITTNDGKKYENVSVSRVEPDGLVVMTAFGVVKVNFTDMPEGQRQKFGYDPSKAEAFRVAQIKASQERETLISMRTTAELEAKAAQLKASQEREIQRLADEENLRKQKEKEAQEAKKMAEESKRLTGQIVAVKDQYAIVYCPKPISVPSSASSLGRIGGGGGGYGGSSSDPRAAYGEFILKNYLQDVAEGDQIKIIAIPDGVENVGKRRLRAYKFIQNQ